MNIAQKILNEMDTPEFEEKMEKWVEEYIKKEKAKEERIQEMMSNTDYIKWLDSFTIKHQSFSDNDWLYCEEEISKEDYEKVNNLHLMYSGIETYANRNYIYPSDCEYGNFYKIKLDNIGFEIGILVGQGTLFFCNRVEIEKDFIDFNDIINNKESDNAIIIKNKLNELSDFVVSLYENGVPYEAIRSRLEDILNEINSEKDLEKEKVLKKK